MEALKDKQVLAIQAESADLVTRAENFQIISEESASTANNVLHWVARAKNSMEERRKFFVQPLNDQVKKINALFKEITQPLLKADAIIRGKVAEYRAKIEEVARKKEQELQRKAEAQRKKQEEKALAKGEDPPLAPPAPKVEVPKTVGGVTMVKTWTYAVLNMDKVPREYIGLDHAEVMHAIRQGVREIPGLRIYQKETVKVGG